MRRGNESPTDMIARIAADIGIECPSFEVRPTFPRISSYDERERIVSKWLRSMVYPRKGPHESRTGREGFVYFIQAVDSGPIKIGWALNAKRRLDCLQTGCPYKLRILAQTPGTVSDERAMHRRFDELHSHGEWFYPGKSLLMFIASLAGHAQ